MWLIDRGKKKQTPLPIQGPPGGEQTDIQWVNGERIERKHFRPDLSIWKSDNWDEYEKAYRQNRNLNF